MNHFEVIQTVSNWFKNKKEVELVTRFSFTFPVPDIQVQYYDGTIVQIECKPSNATRREYLTGLGQAIAFCRHSDKAYLALPYKEFYEMEKWLWPDFIGILLVDYGKVEVHREPKVKPNMIISKEQIGRGYAYYRDLKIKEIYQILKDLFFASNTPLNSEKINQIIWSSLTKLRNWKSSKDSNVLNTKLLLRDLGLFDFNSYQITPLGKELLTIELKEEEKLRNFFRKLFLIEGNYIDIVAIIQQLNEQYSFESIKNFKEKIVETIRKEKMAGANTNIERDLNDIIRILKELEVLQFIKNPTNGKFFRINWNKILHFIKYR